uniref:LRAT domain-containing protein n=1 Tax=Daphnia galeata TaxID=27404 RepID=A0A8J2WPD1_9CRUS|nr:unnamed protein product [Daphnia galeata]
MDRCYAPANELRATKGELIEFQRRLFLIFTYSHYAVYTADVGRMTVGVGSPGYLLRYKIVERTIGQLCNEFGCRVNNLEEAARERGLFPLNPDMIVTRAREFLGRDLAGTYNLLTKNCEHFATLCRYEEGFSQQVSTFFKPFFMLWSAISYLYYSLILRRDVHGMNRIINEVRQNEEQNR